LEPDKCSSLNSLIYVGKNRFGTTGHVWYKGDFGIKGVPV